MEKWLDQLKKWISDEQILKFYKDTILELDDSSYDNICLELGTPENIWKYEQEVNNVFENNENNFENKINFNDFDVINEITLDIKNYHVELESSDNNLFSIENSNLDVELIKHSEFKYSAKIIRKNQILGPQFLINHFDKNKIIKIKIPKKSNLKINCISSKIKLKDLSLDLLELNSKHCQIMCSNIFTNISIYQNLKHSNIIFNTYITNYFKVKVVSHSKLDINNIKVDDFQFKDCNHVYIKYKNIHVENQLYNLNNNCCITYINSDIENLTIDYTTHSMTKFQKTTINKVLINGKNNFIKISKNCAINENMILKETIISNTHHNNHNFIINKSKSKN